MIIKDWDGDPTELTWHSEGDSVAFEMSVVGSPAVTVELSVRVCTEDLSTMIEDLVSIRDHLIS